MKPAEEMERENEAVEQKATHRIDPHPTGTWTLPQRRVD